MKYVNGNLYITRSYIEYSDTDDCVVYIGNTMIMMQVSRSHALDNPTYVREALGINDMEHPISVCTKIPLFTVTFM